MNTPQYLPALDAEDVGQAIIREKRSDLLVKRIVYRFTDEELQCQDRPAACRPYKLTGMMAHAFQGEYPQEERHNAIILMKVNDGHWSRLNEKKRRSEMFHALCHVQLSQKGGLTLVRHDVSGFVSEIKEFGLKGAGLGVIARAAGIQMTFGEMDDDEDESDPLTGDGDEGPMDTLPDDADGAIDVEFKPLPQPSGAYATIHAPRSLPSGNGNGHHAEEDAPMDTLPEKDGVSV